MIDDPIVEQVRDIRDELTRKFDHDIKAIFTDLRERQKSLGHRLISVRASKEQKRDRVEKG